MEELKAVIGKLEAERLKFVNYYNRLPTEDKKKSYSEYSKIDDEFNYLITNIFLLLTPSETIKSNSIL